MIYRHFRLGVFARVIIITLSLAATALLLADTSDEFIAIILGLLAVAGTINLIRYVEQTNRELSRFLESIEYSDFSQSFSKQPVNNSFKQLQQAFSSVLSRFRQVRAEKEEQALYLQTIVQHVGIGLLVFNQDGKVELLNTAAKRLLGVPFIRNINQLDEIHPDLAKSVLNIRGNEKETVKISKQDGQKLELSIYATEFKLHGQFYHLISLQDIHTELETRELEAWQNLTRVLTHEIMNSITPIASLSSTLEQIITSPRENAEELPQNGSPSDDLREGIRTIHKRSKGLIRFVEDYRTFTKIRTSRPEHLPVHDLFDRISRLMQQAIREKNITFDCDINPSNLEIFADPAQIEQVLINLFKNAVEAVEKVQKPEIKLKASLDTAGHILIRITDNGIGIPASSIGKVFVPFYSTKKNGSGIGLSMCRQIMRLHNGSISVQSKPDEETIFTLRF